MANNTTTQPAAAQAQAQPGGLVALGADDKGRVTYEVAGQPVNLSYGIVRNYLTKGNSAVNDADIVQFISICKYQQLNPFLGEAHLVKYGTQPAQMITSKEALMKRAEANEHYKGIEAGVIVMRNGQLLELEGSFYLDEDILLGGWAKVYRDDRNMPIVAKVRLSEYDKKQSTWNEKKSTMIKKVAQVQALREAFPAQLGALYSSEENGGEFQPQPEDVAEQAVQQNANKGGVIEVPAEVATAQDPAQPEDAGEGTREMGF